MAAKPYRLLALVKQDAVVRVQKEPDDTVMTWPHLLSIEFFAAAVISVFLLLMGVFVNAPLEELANRNVTPAVAKAPWYLVGIQELLGLLPPDRRRRAVDRRRSSRRRRWSSRTSTAARAATAARRGRRDRKLGVDAVHDVLRGRPRDHVPRRVLPRTRATPGRPVERRPVLRALYAKRQGSNSTHG